MSDALLVLAGCGVWLAVLALFGVATVVLMLADAGELEIEANRDD